MPQHQNRSLKITMLKWHIKLGENMRYNVKCFKQMVEVDIEANSAIEAQEKVNEMLPGDDNFILKIKAVKPKLVVLAGKIGIMEG